MIVVRTVLVLHMRDIVVKKKDLLIVMELVAIGMVCRNGVNELRTLCFVQITDDRFDKNIKQLLEERVQKLKELLNIDGVEVAISDIEDIHFDGQAVRREDGSIAYWIEPNNQCRCRFQVRKTTRKVSWNDIYDIVNSVKPAVYKFTG